MSLDAINVEKVSREVDHIVNEGKGIVSVIVATADGIKVSGRSTQSGFDEAKLAAIASSIGAIGAVVGDEANLGSCHSVIVQAQRGYALIVEIQHPRVPMIMSVVADSTAVLGQVSYLAREAAAAIARS